MDADFKSLVETTWRDVIADENFHFHTSFKTGQGIHLFYFNDLFQLRFSKDFDPNDRLIMANVTIASLKTHCDSDDWWWPYNKQRSVQNWWSIGGFGIGTKSIHTKNNIEGLRVKMFGSSGFLDFSQSLEWRLMLYKLDKENVYEFYRTHKQRGRSALTFE